MADLLQQVRKIKKEMEEINVDIRSIHRQRKEVVVLLGELGVESDDLDDIDDAIEAIDKRVKRIEKNVRKGLDEIEDILDKR